MHPPDEMRATEVFIGACTTISVTIEGNELQGLLDTGSQVPLMQESFFHKYFAQV